MNGDEIAVDILSTTHKNEVKAEKMMYCMLLFHTVFAMAKFASIAYTVDLLNDAYDDVKMYKLCIILIHIFGTFFPFGIFFMDRLLCTECKYHSIPNSEEDLINELITSHCENEAECYMCGLTRSADMKSLYFNPLGCICKYSLTAMNWYKIYVMQLFIYVFIHTILELTYALITTYSYIEPPVYIGIQIVTYIVCTVPCCFVGNNYNKRPQATP